MGSQLHYQDKNVGLLIPPVDHHWSLVQENEGRHLLSFANNGSSRREEPEWDSTPFLKPAQNSTYLCDFFMLAPSGPSPQSYAWMVKVCSFCNSQSSFSLVRMTPSPVDLSSTTASKGTFCPWILKPQISPERHGKRPKEIVLRITERGTLFHSENKKQKQTHVDSKAIKSQKKTTKKRLARRVFGCEGGLQ